METSSFLDNQLSLFEQSREPRPRDARAPLPKGFNFTLSELKDSDDPEVKKVVERIQGAKSISKNALFKMLDMRSESVDRALLYSPIFKPSTNPTKSLLLEIVPRALERAEERGLVWTAELDRASTLLRDRYRITDIHKEIEAQIKNKVTPLLRKIEDKKSFASLVQQTRSAHLLITAIRETEDLDIWTEQSMLCVKRHMPKALGEIAANKKLTPSQQSFLLDLIVQKSLRPREDGRASKDPFSLDQQYQHGRHSMGSLVGNNPIKYLTERNVRLTSEQIERLLSHRHVYESKAGKVREYLPYEVSRMIQEHIMLTGDTRMALRYIEEVAPINPHSVVSLIQPSAGRENKLVPTMEMFRAAIRHSGRSTVIPTALSEIAVCRQDPEIRAALLNSRSTYIIEHMLKDCGEAEFRKLFRAYSTSDPERASTLLETHRELIDSVCCRKDLLPLLKSSSQKARLLASTIAPQLPISPPKGVQKREPTSTLTR